MSSRVGEQGQFVRREPDLGILLRPRAQVPKKGGGLNTELSTRPKPEATQRYIDQMVNQHRRRSNISLTGQASGPQPTPIIPNTGGTDNPAIPAPPGMFPVLGPNGEMPDGSDFNMVTTDYSQFIGGPYTVMVGQQIPMMMYNPEKSKAVGLISIPMYEFPHSSYCIFPGTDGINRAYYLPPGHWTEVTMSITDIRTPIWTLFDSKGETWYAHFLNSFASFWYKKRIFQMQTAVIVTKTSPRLLTCMYKYKQMMISQNLPLMGQSPLDSVMRMPVVSYQGFLENHNFLLNTPEFLMLMQYHGDAPEMPMSGHSLLKAFLTMFTRHPRAPPLCNFATHEGKKDAMELFIYIWQKNAIGWYHGPAPPGLAATRSSSFGYDHETAKSVMASQRHTRGQSPYRKPEPVGLPPGHFRSRLPSGLSQINPSDIQIDTHGSALSLNQLQDPMPPRRGRLSSVSSPPTRGYWDQGVQSPGTGMGAVGGGHQRRNTWTGSATAPF